MKKWLFSFFLLFLCTGCVNIHTMEIEDILNTALQNEKIVFKNRTSQGYSYYLPLGLSVLEDHLHNITLKKDKYSMYLYLDLISYYNAVKEEYTIQKEAFYSTKIINGDKFGYLEINFLENKKYLIEIMYNYAKIEVIVDYRDINEMLSFAMALLSSISYNDTIIASMIGNDTLNASEIEFNIFETAKNESNLIQYDENSATNEKKNDLPDTDMIN